jgi:hypothetical protein
MKNSLWFVASVALFLGSCSTGNKMQSSATTDDLYVAKTESYVAPATDQVNSNDEYQSNSSTESDEVTSEKYSDESGNTYITNNYYDNNSYTSQLDRWYNPGLGFGYFSPFYTGYSFYDPFHYSPGFSISIGFNQGWGNSWYNPYYYPMYSYNPWNPYYNPWYSSGFGYNPYGNGFGYNPYGYGYSNGYYDGYYSSAYSGGYSSGNSYSGPRGSVSSNTSGNGDGRQYKTVQENQEISAEPVNSTPSNVESIGKGVDAPVKQTPSVAEPVKRGNEQITNPRVPATPKESQERNTPKLNLPQANSTISNELLFNQSAPELDSKRPIVNNLINNKVQIQGKPGNSSQPDTRMNLDKGDERPSLNNGDSYTPANNKSRPDSDNNRNSNSKPRRK